jgi:hypothetical protein
MYENIKFGILGGIVGLLLFVVGLFAATRVKGIGLFFVYIASLGAYFALVAEGQVDGPYRQLGIIPAISVFVAIGALAIMISIVSMLFHILRTDNRLRWSRLIVFAGCLALFLVTPIRKYDEIVGWVGPEEPVHADRWGTAQKVKELTSEESKLIVAGEYTIHAGGNDLSPVLYYYSGRQGWTIQPWEWNQETIYELIDKGATYFVATRPLNLSVSAPLLGDLNGLEFLNGLKDEYSVLYDGEDSVILDIHSSISP